MPDPGVHSPIIEFFRRGEVARDVRELAARGALATGPHEQLALLILLTDDPDAAIAATAAATIESIPAASLGAFLARPDVPPQMRDFFAARGVQPVEASVVDIDEPLVPVDESDQPDEVEKSAEPTLLSALSVMERMKLAMKGTREQRAVLIRDPNRLVSAAVLSSPKLNTSEIEAFARMSNVAEESLRIIATNRAWIKNYAVVAALVRNPKTPPALSLHFVPRLVEKDIKGLASDRNVPEILRISARRVLTKSRT
jgi:hypothetical protein